MYHLLKYDPRRRWTVEEAIASPWLRRFAPGGPDASPPYSQATTGGLSSSSSLAGTAAAAAGLDAAESMAVDASSVSLVSALAYRETSATAAIAAAAGAGEGEGGNGVEREEGEGEGPMQPSIKARMLSSMRDYRSYGALRRTALMVVAYNQAPEKLRELRNEFVEFDTVSFRKIVF